MRSGPAPAHPQPPTLDRLVVIAGRQVQRATAQAAATVGLGTTGMAVLAALVAHGPVSGRDLAGHVGVSPATLTPVLDRLAAADALTRERQAGDRRALCVAVTPHGRELLEAASAAVATRVRARMPCPEKAGSVHEYLLSIVRTFAADDLDDPGDLTGFPAGPAR